MRKADNLTTILCRCHENLGNLTSWNPLGHSRPVTGSLLVASYWPGPSILCYWHFLGSLAQMPEHFFPPDIFTAFHFDFLSSLSLYKSLTSPFKFVLSCFLPLSLTSFSLHIGCLTKPSLWLSLGIVKTLYRCSDRLRQGGQKLGIKKKKVTFNVASRKDSVMYRGRGDKMV